MQCLENDDNNSVPQKLGATSLTVTSESFVPMLSRIDECIAYIQSNVSILVLFYCSIRIFAGYLKLKLL